MDEAERNRSAKLVSLQSEGLHVRGFPGVRAAAAYVSGDRLAGSPTSRTPTFGHNARARAMQQVRLKESSAVC